MALIVSQNVGGDIICGCETACCLFPYDYYTDPDAEKYANLPDAVVFNGDTISLGSPPNIQYGTPGSGLWINLDFSFNWQFLLDGDVLFTASCLITSSDGNTVEDQFSNTYLVTDDSGGNPPQVVTRVSQCQWTGGPYSLQYFRDDLLGNFYPKFRITILGAGHEKEAPQSSPVGQYGTPGSGYVVS